MDWDATALWNITSHNSITAWTEIRSPKISIMQRSVSIVDGTNCISSFAVWTIVFDGTSFYGCKGNWLRKKLDN
jgi:hypothetical protein